MDQENEVRRFKRLLFFGIGLLVSLFVVREEALYFFGGRTTEGFVTTTEIVESHRRFRTSEKLVINYRYTDAAGNGRFGSDEISASDTSVPRAGPIRVVYRGGPDGPSRIAGHVNWGGLILAAVLFGIVSWHVLRVLKDARDYSREMKAREKASPPKRYRF